jgi:hypothetical protein
MTDSKIHSRLGIVSSLLALSQSLSALSCIIAIMYKGAAGVESTRTFSLTVALVLIAGLIGNVAGIVLGIFGVHQSERKRLFSVIGLVSNIASPLILITFTILINVL